MQQNGFRLNPTRKILEFTATGLKYLHARLLNFENALCHIDNIIYGRVVIARHFTALVLSLAQVGTNFKALNINIIYVCKDILNLLILLLPVSK